jgi:hypothetical protein
LFHWHSYGFQGVFLYFNLPLTCLPLRALTYLLLTWGCYWKGWENPLSIQGILTLSLWNVLILLLSNIQGCHPLEPNGSHLFMIQENVRQSITKVNSLINKYNTCFSSNITMIGWCHFYFLVYSFSYLMQMQREKHDLFSLHNMIWVILFTEQVSAWVLNSALQEKGSWPFHNVPMQKSQLNLSLANIIQTSFSNTSQLAQSHSWSSEVGVFFMLELFPHVNSVSSYWRFSSCLIIIAVNGVNLLRWRLSL